MKPILSNPQKTAYSSLLSHSKYYFRKDKAAENHPLKMRTNLLVCGSSGSGKSHLIKMLSEELNTTYMRLNISNWAVIGCKKSEPTFENIYRFIEDNESGIIFLDEIDKIGSGNGEWVNSIKLEIHDLLDGKTPHAISIEPPLSDAEDIFESFTKSNGSSPATLWENPGEYRDHIENKLKNNFLIIGAGAWHNLWDFKEQQSIGFQLKHENTSLKDVKSLNPKLLSNMLSPEIQRRFASRPIFIPRMCEQDYIDLISTIATAIPRCLRDEFRLLATSRTPEALEHHFEYRMIEDVLQESVLENYAYEQLIEQDKEQKRTLK